MKKILVMAAGALLSSPLLAAPYIDNEAPLVAANAYLDLADAGGRVVAVGDRGKILFSDDQGGHWKTAVAPSEVLLTAVCFADARHGWAVGHDAVVLGTDDGGETWTLQYSDPLGGGESSDVEEEPLDDLFGIDFLSLGLITDDEAVPQDIRSNSLDIFRSDITAPTDKCVGAGSAGQKDSGPRRRTMFNEVDHILEIDLRQARQNAPKFTAMGVTLQAQRLVRFDV